MKQSNLFEKPKVLVSECCCGVKCRYNGNGYMRKIVIKLQEKYTIIPFCPEVEGGLPTPREGCSVCQGKVIGRRTGKDFTKAYTKGAQKALKLCKEQGITKAFLLKNSPSCGKDYGIAACLLDKKKIEVVGI